MITPSLDSVSDPEIVNLHFDYDPPEELLLDFETNTQISISDYNHSYEYNLAFSPKQKRSISVRLNYSKSFVNKPTFKLVFDLSLKLRTDDSFYLTKKELSTTLPDYYPLSSSNKATVKSTADNTEKGSQVARAFMVIQNVLNIGSSFAVKSLVLMELIRFLRYIEIK